MTYEFRPAKREGVGLLIGLAGASGSGKTYSAMRLAKGMVGPGGRFAVIDTEAGRAKHYADQFEFDHCDMRPPFRPENYADAIAAADKAGYKAIVVDSMSHEWAGEGGILDWQDEELDRMAGDDWKKREACKMAAWIKPKMAHKAMVQRLLQVRAHLILCFRAEEKLTMERDPESRKMVIHKKEGLTGFDGWFPICEKSLPFELTASFLMLPNAPGVGLPLKLQEQHKPAFQNGQAISEAAGEYLRLWASGDSVSMANIALGGKPLTATELNKHNEQYGRSALSDAARALGESEVPENLIPKETPAKRPGLLSERAIADWLAAMEGAATGEELQRIFSGSILAASEVKDVAAKDKFIAKKDECKKNLGVK